MVFYLALRHIQIYWEKQLFSLKKKYTFSNEKIDKFRNMLFIKKQIDLVFQQ
ncbi:hypothetical protein [Acinetobacter pittii]|uniref:hypothetical protein n=1 Tax=Acinetobacter pittii TaxID=48296 RepID=UPI0012D83562|nr:hypothetical protein [Acinetobacter pittii]